MQETGKENAKQDRKNNKKKWMILAVCAFAAAILLIGFIAGTWWMEKKAEQEYLAMQEKNAEKRQKVPEEEKKIDIPVDFDSLQKENPDIYAWITIPDTVIDYPIVQSSEDNAYYLNHSAEKTDSASGAIYSENYNKKNFDDPITLLYGHNMKDGSMFAGLHKYEEDTYFNDHKDLVIYTPDAILKYKIFAAYRTDDRHILLYYNLGAEDYNRQAYLNDILNQRTMGAMLDQSAPVSTESKILTLSTCDRAGDAYRYVVQAYLVEKMEWNLTFIDEK